MSILFLIIAAIGLLAALGAVTARNLVHAALYLVAFFFLVACQFVLLEAEFMAAIQVLVYIGAVAILLMFGIMLTRNIQGDETTGGHWSRKVPAALAGLGMLVMLVVGIRDESGPNPSADRATPSRPPWTAIPARPPLTDEAGEPTDARSAAIGDMSRVVGDEMMTRFVIPFEVAGLLLTAAVVGAVALAMSDRLDDETTRPGPRSSVRSSSTGGDGNGHLAPPVVTPDLPPTPASAPR